MSAYDKKVSLASIRRLSGFSDDSSMEDIFQDVEHYEERKWRLSHLRAQFNALELYKLFKPYTDKINHGYFSLFLILEFLLSLTHFFVIFYTVREDKLALRMVLPDLGIYLFIAFLSLVGIFAIDTIVKNYKNWQYLPILSFVAVFFANFFVPLYHVNDGQFRPAYTTHLIISCYVFLNVYDNVMAVVVGVMVSIGHLCTLGTITYKGTEMLWQRLLSDSIFLICINGLGIYFRYMNEIVKRRSFLDRRECILSMFQIRHQKEQEEQLMSSIIPDNIIKIVREHYMKQIGLFLSDNLQSFQENPLDDKFLENHEHVSILFADIVNYTEMTLKLNITELLETLNMLFGSFDDASEEFNVTRIKFLGDCYYCVAGMPPYPAPNHAEGCVDLGLRMIAIIAGVRKRRNLNIDMRIGVHTGKVISGVIGSVKYQFDVWSKDVDIANRMETEGCPGKVHITNKTKDLLSKTYDVIKTVKGETIPQFKQNNIETFLVSPPIKPPENPQEEPDVVYKEISETERNLPRPSLYKKRTPTSNGFLSLGTTSGSSFLAHLHRATDEDSDTHAITTITEEPEVSPEASPIAKSRYSDGALAEHEVELSASTRRIIEKRRFSANPKIKRNLRNSEERRWTEDVKRRTAFMNSNFKRYSEMSEAVDKEMESTIEKLSFSKYEQFFKVQEINSLLCFRNRRRELEYIQVPDPLFKYYLLSEIAVVLCVFVIQNLTLASWDWYSWPFYISLLVIVISLPITWSHYIWIRYITQFKDIVPQNSTMKFLYDASKFIKDNVLARLVIYTAVCGFFSFYVLSEVVDCEELLDDETSVRTKGTLLGLFIRSNMGGLRSECIIPWHMTETCSMAIIMTFLFLRTMVWVKFLYATVITIIYSFCVMSFSKGFYTNSETFNVQLDPQIAHIISVIFLTFTLHLIDRQTDYMNRLDYLWNQRLLENQNEANELQLVNQFLLYNILPRHVAKQYLDVSIPKDELYYESHKNVAVMFASLIIDFPSELEDRKVLLYINNYINAFDTISRNADFYKNIEKIKIAKWTYMAACGLVPGGGSNNVLEQHNTRAPVLTLLTFAAKIMESTESLNKENGQSIKLRIGISQGPIVAGVVGSKKPHYDIWGDAVNMASRMDSTGEVNRIQVMPETAEIVDKLGYVCNYRGETRVKGRDSLIPTYFVALDDNYNLIKKTVIE